METVRRTTVVGVFDDPEGARAAIEALKDSGFGAEDIGVLMKDPQQARETTDETGSHASEGALTGAIGGGLLGGLAGWLVGIGSLAIPGVGPFIAAGAIGTALAGAGIGAGVGAVAGALVGMGIPREEAEWYEGEVKKGRTLLTVKTDGQYAEAHAILRRFGAYDIENRYVGTASMVSEPAPLHAGAVAEAPALFSAAEPRGGSMWEGEPVVQMSAADPTEDGMHETRHNTDYDRSGGTFDENPQEFEIVGGENYPPHEHRFIDERCEECGAIRRFPTTT